VLTSFDHAKKWDNKVEKNIKGLDTLKHMPKIANFHVIASPPYSNMGGENESTESPSYFHPSPLHPNVVLHELHT
jgi:hypothetical protein